MNWNSQVFRYDAADVQGPRTSIVTALPGGVLADGYCMDTSISADGRYVAFRSAATNLDSPAPAPETLGVFVRDMTDGTFTRVDVLGNGDPFDHLYPYTPTISADGTAVAFMSNAVNAVDGQYSWGAQHVFVATAFSVTAASASHPAQGGSGSIDVNTLPASGWNAVSLDPWITLTDGAGFAAGPRTVQYSVDPNASGIVRDGRIRLGSRIIDIHQDGDGDTTPPVVTPIVTGTLSASGWYTSDITVQWTVTDPESEIVSTGYGCGVTSTFTTDFIYASPTCEATSHGGTTTVSVPLRRDTTAPSIYISNPAPTLYPTGAHVVPVFGCDDSHGYSGLATCAITAGASPLDTLDARMASVHGDRQRRAREHGDADRRVPHRLRRVRGAVPGDHGVVAIQWGLVRPRATHRRLPERGAGMVRERHRRPGMDQRRGHQLPGHL